jgi:2-oxoglutarate dehydrogenase E1 component
VLRPWRKPLVVMTPKSLLRVAATSKGPNRPVSTITDLSEGRFRRVLPDLEPELGGCEPRNVKRILLCSGKVYFDLAQAREARGRTDVAILRLEQLYPLHQELRDALEPYARGTELVWVQEEPKNYGSWYYVNSLVREFLGDRFPLRCVARAASASPATGSKGAHVIEHKLLLDEAFG